MSRFQKYEDDLNNLPSHVEDEYVNGLKRDFKLEELKYELRHEEPELYKARLKRINLETK
jgi:hypothetical protein